MTPTTTFQDIKKLCTLVVKATFLEKCPEPAKYTLMELNRDFNMLTYLHNENGPAVIRPSKNIEEFWLDGKSITKENPELAARMKHKLGFDDRFNSFVGEEANAATAVVPDDIGNK